MEPRELQKRSVADLTSKSSIWKTIWGVRPAVPCKVLSRKLFGGCSSLSHLPYLCTEKVFTKPGVKVWNITLAGRWCKQRLRSHQRPNAQVCSPGRQLWCQLKARKQS